MALIAGPGGPAPGGPARRPVALTIAGSDSSGGAGIIADLKTFEALGVWGGVAITAVTAQNTRGVLSWQPVAPALITAQIAAVVEDPGVDVAKTGMLGSTDGVRAAVAGLRAAGIGLVVVDPVLVSTRGDRLLAADALDVLRDELFPLATVITPNLPEAAALLGSDIGDRDQMMAAAAELHQLGPKVVVIKGGHLADRERSPDLVYTEAGPHWLDGRRIPTGHTHGTGCVFSAAIAAGMALGRDPLEACVVAKQFVTGAIDDGVAGAVDPGWAGRPGPASRGVSSR